MVVIFDSKYAERGTKRWSESEISKVLKDSSNKEINKHILIDKISLRFAKLPYQNLPVHKKSSILITARLQVYRKTHPRMYSFVYLEYTKITGHT